MNRQHMRATPYWSIAFLGKYGLMCEVGLTREGRVRMTCHFSFLDVGTFIHIFSSLEVSSGNTQNCPGYSQGTY